MEKMSIILASDHGGWRLKEDVRAYLAASHPGVAVLDLSRPDEEPVDYTTVGLAAARMVARGEATRAILLCGTGLGMSILANKVPGIRACLCTNGYIARMSRAHNDCNVLVLGGRVLGPALARDIVAEWLETPFEGGRHARRLETIFALDAAAPGDRLNPASGAPAGGSSPDDAGSRGTPTTER